MNTVDQSTSDLMARIVVATGIETNKKNGCKVVGSGMIFDRKTGRYIEILQIRMSSFM